MSNDHKKHIVYKVTNQINKMVYIGQTKMSLSRRRIMHESRSRTNPQTPFHKALSEFGLDKFSWEVLEEVSTEIESRTLETKYIKQYNSVETGYNTNYGDGCPLGRKLSKESIEKIRKSNQKPRPYKRGPNAADAKKYIVTTPNKDEYYVHGLSDFCRRWTSDKLYMELLIKVAKGERNHHKGYKCRYASDQDVPSNFKTF